MQSTDGVAPHSADAAVAGIIVAKEQEKSGDLRWSNRNSNCYINIYNERLYCFENFQAGSINRPCRRFFDVDERLSEHQGVDGVRSSWHHRIYIPGRHRVGNFSEVVQYSGMVARKLFAHRMSVGVRGHDCVPA